jgi:hypothetical protein
MSSIGRILTIALATLSASAAPAQAAPPANLSVGVERLFGISRAWQGGETGSQDEAQTSISLFTQHAERLGYSSTRLGVDGLLDMGLSFGGAFGLGKYRGDYLYDDTRQNALLLVSRVGFYLAVLPELGVWPRLGVMVTTPRLFDDGSLPAFMFEVPVTYVLSSQVAGLTLTPHYEKGISTRRNAAYGTVSEVGVSAGVNVFF